MALRLYYPVKPFRINQVFGANPDYYARFHDQFGNPEKGHMGIDLTAYHGQPVYAACDGFALFVTDDHGGEGIHIRAADGTNAYNVIHWHLIGNTDPAFPSPIPNDNKYHLIKAGDLIGYADNTGAPFESSGDHLHFGLTPLLGNGNPVDPANGFNGCVDPTTYFTGIYAEDIRTLVQKLASLVGLLSSLVSLLKSKGA